MDQKDIKDIADVIEEQEWLTPAATGLQNAVGGLYEAGGKPGQKIKNFLNGTWFGHPLHPAIVTVPLGAWTVTLILDILDGLSGRDDFAPAAQVTTGIGLISAVGSAATGITDWQSSGEQSPRAGLVHGLLNTAATGLYLTSWIMRRRGAREAGRNVSLLGYAIVMASAYLGGELAYGQRIGVDHAEREGLPGDWVSVLPEDELPENELKRVEANGIKVLLVRRGERIFAIGEVCSHLGGPLAEGELEDCSVRCPWHGSRFCLETGKPLDGPATYLQPIFETRVHKGQIEVKAARSAPAQS